MTGYALFAAIVSIALAWCAVIYNLLIRDKNRTLAAWSDIDVQLKRRHDLIPKLIDTARQYLSYEQTLLTAVTELRARSEQGRDVEMIGSVESELGDKLQQLMLIAEDYPDLKADRLFLELQQNLSDVEEHIQYARRYYNGSVRNLNTRIDSFPDLVIARLFHFQPMAYFQLERQ